MAKALPSQFGFIVVMFLSSFSADSRNDSLPSEAQEKEVHDEETDENSSQCQSNNGTTRHKLRWSKSGTFDACWNNIVSIYSLPHI